MTMFKGLKIPKLIRWIFVVGIIFLLWMGLLRLVFYFVFNHTGNPISALGATFLLGFRFDLKMICFLLEFMLLLGALNISDPFISSRSRRGFIILLAIMCAITSFIYTVDFAHYSYLNLRLSASVLNYIQDAGISLNLVWENYPVIRMLLAILLFSFLIWWLLIRVYRQIARSTDNSKTNRKWIWIVGAFILFGLGIFGNFGQYNLRWSEAFSLGNDYRANLALNPYQSFFSSLKFRSSVFNPESVRKAYPILKPYFGFTGDSLNLNYERTIIRPIPVDRPNIVVVICESFSAYKSSMWGNPLNTTPFFKSICDQGIFFDQCFTPSYGTARGVWAVLTGIPDVGQANSTTSRNPGAVNQHTIVNDFKGYDKYYFIGGSASWANIRGLLNNNIYGLHLYEQENYKASKIDVWGISDKNLFLEANQVLRKQESPFFAIIQTADNHRPYTIPAEDQGEFHKIRTSADSLKAFGFESNDEMNAFRFTDFCYQKFIEAAKKEKYFSNTIFVFVGDHGIAGDAGKMFPRAWTNERLDNMHVPLLFYSPGLLKPKRIHDFVSQVDLLPTAAGLANISYRNTTLGRDLLNSAYDAGKAFSFLYDPDQGYVDLLMGSYLYRNNLNTHGEDMYSIVGNDPVNTLSVADSLHKMSTLTKAYYETARFMLLNNKKKP
jgi:phosphoglycerol transferase MdoB-like AlkP superfamily enzyme